MKKDRITNVVERFIITGKMQRMLFEAQIKDLGLHHSQHKVLMFLAERGENKPSQKEIAQKFEISAAAVAVTLKKLEKNGYITKTVLDKDNRINNVSMTEKAKMVVRKSKELIVKLENEIFEDFTQEELADFCKYLDKMQSSVIRHLNS